MKKAVMNDALFVALMVCNALSVSLMYLCLTDDKVTEEGRWFTAGIGAVCFLMTWALVWTDRKEAQK
jgi:hypothetical protein